jgi:hypothetical protein
MMTFNIDILFSPGVRFGEFMDAKVLDSPRMTAMGTYGILVSNTMVPLQESFTGFRSALCVW